MIKFIRPILAVFSVCALAALPAQAEPVAKVVADYTVFVDPPSGFTYVKLPTGWVFVGKVEAAHVAKLPPTVVTALLAGRYVDEDTALVAGSQAAKSR
ncbi:conserved exported hypothetical protein [Rubrivivax sp. A210]|uniref:hypothetical protein n=1 Tax=Rubrivivax sp. A210 TaxID=2772301 RepID=UPI001919977F|nr:hypothetical protein [Rubrivivax sp. A210]CAD5374265.1 conserved exported hypothetical protein [Rubrivivax sp. A210]